MHRIFGKARQPAKEEAPDLAATSQRMEARGASMDEKIKTIDRELVDIKKKVCVCVRDCV